MTKFGWACVPNSRLKISMQELPHDGVAALAESAPTVLTPPTTVSVTAAASTLLLMDMKQIPFLLQPRPAHGCGATTTERNPLQGIQEHTCGDMTGTEG